MSDQPPVQRDEAWLSKASEQQIVDALEGQELHALQGGTVDSDGWPVTSNGKRLDVARRSS